MSLEAWGDENPADADYDTWADRAMDAGWFDPADYSPGAIAIMRERERQETKEGWTPEHDDTHRSGEMASAAACYLTWPFSHIPASWPWARNWWKLKDRRSNLVRAGALIAAEIDRLDRAAARSSK